MSEESPTPSAPQSRVRAGLNSGVALTGLGVAFAVVVVLVFSRIVGGTTTLSTSCAATATAAANVNRTPPAGPPAAAGTPTSGAQGLRYLDIVPGCGPSAQQGSTVTIIYTGWTQAGGKLFDSSLRHTPKTFQIPSPLGSDQPTVIQGFNLGLIGMQLGGTRRLIVPPALAYGAQGNSALGVPPGATLIFDVTLVAVSS